MSITLRDRQEWAYHPVTQDLIGYLKESIQATMQSWASQHYIEPGANEAALGHVRALHNLLAHIEEHKMEEVLDESIGEHSHAH